MGVVEDIDPRAPAGVEIFAGDFSIDVNVAADHLDRFSRKPDQAFDVRLRRLGRIPEDNHFPTFGILEQVVVAVDE